MSSNESEILRRAGGGLDKAIDSNEVGLSARQLADGEMDSSWRNHMGGGGGYTDVDEQARGRAEVMKAKRIVESVGGLSMEDMVSLSVVGGDITRTDAATLSRAMGSVIDQGARQNVQDAYYNPTPASDLMEQQAYQPAPQDTGWTVTKQGARLKSGKTIPVFVVEDSITGMTTGRRYRRFEVAEKVARVINATGNPEDSRIAMIDRAYDKHVELMQNIQRHRKMVNEGQSDKRGRLSVLETELLQVNNKLGIH